MVLCNKNIDKYIIWATKYIIWATNTKAKQCTEEDFTQTAKVHCDGAHLHCDALSQQELTPIKLP